MSVDFLRVKGWREHQHYKTKKGEGTGPPPWIKLYRRILTDYSIRGLPEADRFKLVALWLLASDTDGTIPNDAKYVANCIGVKRINLDLFVSRGFLESVYTDSRPILALSESEDIRLRADQTENGTVASEHALVRLLAILHDSDLKTEAVIRGIVKGGSLAQGDIEYARECALGPDVESRTKVAVAMLKKRRAA